MTVPLRKRAKRRLRSVIVVAAVRLVSLVPLPLALAFARLVGVLAAVAARAPATGTGSRPWRSPTTRRRRTGSGRRSG